MSSTTPTCLPQILRLQKTLDAEFAHELAAWDGQTGRVDPTGFRLHAGDGYRGNARERQLSLRADADQRLWPPLLAGCEQHHRIQRQRQRRPLCVLRGWRIPVRAHDSGISAFGSAGDRECRSESSATADANLRQSVSAAGYLRLHEIWRFGFFGRQTEHVVGTGRKRRHVDEQQCRPVLDAPNQSHGTDQHSRDCQSSWGLSRRPTTLERSHGHQFPVGPYFFGQKVSFKPTENLEFGFTRNDVFGGQGHVPITFGSFWNSFTSFNDVTRQVKFSRNDPGARHASFDFSWRLPFVRRWLTLYSDSLVHDDVNPVSAPRRSAVNPGIYLTHFPGLPKLDFRAEAVYTDPPTPASIGGNFIYWEVIYHDLYLNNKFLMGNWIGREGKGYQAWSTYHLSPQSSIQVGVRNGKIANDFIPGGSTQWDWNVSAMLRVRKDLEVKSFLQYETWWVPVLAPTRQTDFTSSVQLTWWPTSVGIRKAFR